MDTDPNPEVSALLSALDDTPKDEDTGETGESDNLEADEQDSAEEAQPEAPEDENESPAKLVLEFDGKQWELPPGTPPEIAEGVKKVADELKADYTRKRQVAAEQEKTIRQHAEALQESQQIAAATFEKSLELSLISRQIQQIESIDWQALANEDPSRASVLQMEHTKLMRQAQALQGQVQQMAMHERQKLQTTKQEAANRLTATAKEIIPGYNDKTNKELLDVFLHCGFAAEEAGSINRPELLKLINYARMGLALEKNQPKAMKKANDAPRVMKPQAPAPRKQNQSALDRLKKTGRASELVNFL